MFFSLLIHQSWEGDLSIFLFPNLVLDFSVSKDSDRAHPQLQRKAVSAVSKESNGNGDCSASGSYRRHSGRLKSRDSVGQDNLWKFAFFKVGLSNSKVNHNRLWNTFLHVFFSRQYKFYQAGMYQLSSRCFLRFKSIEHKAQWISVHFSPSVSVSIITFLFAFSCNYSRPLRAVQDRPCDE